MKNMNTLYDTHDIVQKAHCQVSEEGAPYFEKWSDSSVILIPEKWKVDKYLEKTDGVYLGDGYNKFGILVRIYHLFLIIQALTI